MKIYSNARDTTTTKVRTSEPRDQGVIDTSGIKVQYGPAPKPVTPPPLFSRTAPGIDPLTVEAWQ